MRTIQTTVYKFDELSKEAKEKAKADYYNTEDYPFLNDNLTERCKELLKDSGVEFSNISLLYSLGYSQGDGLCFTGTLTKDGNTLTLTHSYRYYFANSVTMDFTDKDGEYLGECEELKAIYFDVCEKLEKEGYAELEYRMNDEEFADLSDCNNWEYTQDGKLI